VWCSSQCANLRIARSCCGRKSHLLWLLGPRRTEFPQVNGETLRRWIPTSISSKEIPDFLVLFARRAVFLCNFEQVVFVKWRFPSKRGGFVWPSLFLLRRLHRLRLPTATGFWHFDNSLSNLCKARTGPSGIWDVARRGGGTSFRIDLLWVSKNELQLPNTEFCEALKTTAKRIIEFIIFAAAFSHLSSCKNLNFFIFFEEIFIEL